jgi:hypothetical protein
LILFSKNPQNPFDFMGMPINFRKRPFLRKHFRTGRRPLNKARPRARVAELVDALDLGSSSGDGVGVQVSPLAPKTTQADRLAVFLTDFSQKSFNLILFKGEKGNI